MLHIIFLILEILLFTVLILLGLVLLLVVLLLFVPIRYKLYAEKKNENFICKLKASWLDLSFCLKANYDENGFVYRLRSFGGTIVSNQEEFTGDEETRKDETSKKRAKSRKPIKSQSRANRKTLMKR